MPLPSIPPTRRDATDIHQGLDKKSGEGTLCGTPRNPVEESAEGNDPLGQVLVCPRRVK